MHYPRKNSYQNRAWPLGIRVMRTVCLLGGVFALSGCGGDPASKTTEQQSVEEAPKVVILSWDEYFAPEVLAEFTKRTGIEVDVQVYESTDEMTEKLRSNPQNYDVLVAEQAAIVSLRLGRLLSKLDPEKLAHEQNMDPAYLNQDFDPKNEFSIPYMWGTTVLAYRKDHFKTTPSYSLKLLSEESQSGKISLLNERNECYAMMLKMTGHPLKDVSADSLLTATDALLSLMKNQRTRFGSDNDMKAHLIDGSSSVAMIYSGDAALIAQDNPNIGYFIPNEGAVVWIDSFAIPRDATRPQNAHRFIDYMIEAEVGAKSSNFLRYASPNKAAGAFIDADLLSDATIYPPEEIRQKCSTMPLWNKDQLRMMNSGWKLAQESLQTTDIAERPEAKPANPTSAVSTTEGETRP